MTASVPAVSFELQQKKNKVNPEPLDCIGLTLLPLKPPKVGIAYLVKFAQGDFVIFK